MNNAGSPDIAAGLRRLMMGVAALRKAAAALVVTVLADTTR